MADPIWTLVPLDDKLYKHFTNLSQVYVMGTDRFCYPKNGPEIVARMKSLPVKDDDVCVVSFPKTGSTWMQEIVYLLMNNVDVAKANTVTRDQVFPYADINVWEDEEEDMLEVVNNLASPRLIKYHLNYHFLPPDVVSKCKVIYVSRNVKDTIVSNYYFHCAMTSTIFRGSIEDFTQFFLDDKVPYAPYVTHVKQFWKKRDEKNIFFTTYEEMQKDQEKVIKELSDFLNTPVTDEEIKIIANHCKFDTMKTNPAANKSNWGDAVHDKEYQFMRKGIVGDWKTQLTPELIAKVDRWIIDETTDCPEIRDIL